MRNPILLLVLFVFFSSCVGKKKHISMLANQEAQLETLRRGEVSKLNVKLRALQESLREYEISAATQSGSISTLETLRKELSDKNRQLEEQLEALNSKSNSSVQNLNTQLQEKNNEINALNAKIDQIKKVLDQEAITVGTLTGDLRPALGFADPNLYSFTSTREALKLQLNEDLLFTKGSISKLSSDGKTLLASLANVFNRFPAVQIEIRGHTDNSKPKTGYSDNWTIGAIRAVNVTRELIDESAVNSSQLTATSKGEYEPMSSNMDDAGKKSNRRIEFILTPAAENLVKKIQAIAG